MAKRASRKLNKRKRGARKAPKTQTRKAPKARKTRKAPKTQTRKAPKTQTRKPPKPQSRRYVYQIPRDAKGRFISGTRRKLDLANAQVRELLEELIQRELQILKAASEPFFRQRLGRFIAIRRLQERIEAAKEGREAFLTDFRAQQARTAKAIHDIRDGRIRDYTGPELSDIFGSLYDDDPHEFYDIIVYGET